MSDRILVATRKGLFRIERVADGRMGLDRAAVLVHDGREREAIDVVDLTGSERLARCDHLVAGREDGHARPHKDVDVRDANGGDGSDPPG